VAALPLLRFLEHGRLFPTARQLRSWRIRLLSRTTSGPLSAARWRRALPLLSPLLPPSPPPLLSLSVVEQENGENPNAVGERPAGVRSWNVGARSRQLKSKDAAAPGDWACGLRRRRGRSSMAGGAPGGVASDGKGVFSPWGLPQASVRAQQLDVRADRAVRPSHQAYMRARPGVHTLAWKRKKVWRKG
jgi:hypothetical protein